MRPALLKPVVRGEMGGGRLPAPGRLALRGDLLSGVGRCEMTQAPHALSGAFFTLVPGAALQQTSGVSEAAVGHRWPGWPPPQLQ